MENDFLKQLLSSLYGLILLSCSIFMGGADVSASNLKVYGEGEYIYDNLVVKIYADIPTTEPLLSFGFKINYDPLELSIHEDNIILNDHEWYLYFPENSMPSPNKLIDTSSQGSVSVFGSKIDNTSPCAGVGGDRILLAALSFGQVASNIVPSLSLSLGRENPNFSNFVQTDGGVIDTFLTMPDGTIGNITFKEPEIRDADGDGVVDMSDYQMIIGHIGDPVSECPSCDINGNGTIESLDARALVLMNTYNPITTTININSVEFINAQSEDLELKSFSMEFQFINLRDSFALTLKSVKENRVSQMGWVLPSITFDIAAMTIHIPGIYFIPSGENVGMFIWIELKLIEFDPAVVWSLERMGGYDAFGKPVLIQ